MGTLPTLGLNASFSLATTAMGAQRAAIEVTGHNISNANTAGYARQRLNLQTATPIQTAIGAQGTGVVVQGIEQLRDSYMDKQIPGNVSELNYYEERNSLLTQLQTNLNEPLDRTNSIAASFPDSPGTGLNQAIQDFFNSWNQLSADPANMTIRQRIIVNAQNVTGQLNDIATRLQNTQVQVENNVSTNVSEINDLASSIASLNSAIKAQELGHLGPANDLRDRRQELIEELSKRINIFTQEETDGTVSVRIGDRSGNLLVSGVFSGNTEFADTVKLASSGSNVGLRIQSWTRGETESPGNLDDLDLQPTKGTLIAQVEISRDIIGDNSTGLVSDYDAIAAALAELVNPVFASGFTLEGSPNYATAGNSTFFDDDTTNGNLITQVRAINFQLNSFVAADPARIAASDTAGQPTNGGTAVAITQLQSDLTGTGLGGLTVQNFYLNTVSSLGAKVTTSQGQISTYKILGDQLEKQRNSVMGVDINEEMTNLLQYQFAFQAAAELVNTVNTMMQAVLAAPR